MQINSDHIYNVTPRTTQICKNTLEHEEINTYNNKYDHDIKVHVMYVNII